MTSRIQPLSQGTSNQIHAQQRFESQLAAIKELVENSIDGNAKTIKIYVDKATFGLESITVEDDGCGIGKDDLRKVLQPNTSSKQAQVESEPVESTTCEGDTGYSELATPPNDATDNEGDVGIPTYGCNGLALYSLSQIAGSVAIFSKIADSRLAYRVHMEGSLSQMTQPVSCSRRNGTTVQVIKVLDKVPVRHKSLVGKATSQKAAILGLLQQYAYEYGKSLLVQLFCGKNNSLVYSSKMPTKQKLKNLEVRDDKITMRMAIGLNTDNSSKLRLLINRRPVFSGNKVHPVTKLVKKHLQDRAATGFISLILHTVKLDFGLETTKSWTTIPQAILDHLDTMLENINASNSKPTKPVSTTTSKPEENTVLPKLTTIQPKPPLKVPQLPKPPRSNRVSAPSVSIMESNRAPKTEAQTTSKSPSSIPKSPVKRPTPPTKPKAPPMKKTYRAADIDINEVKSIKPLPEGIKSYSIKEYIGKLPNSKLSVALLDRKHLVATDGDKIETLVEDVEKL